MDGQRLPKRVYATPEEAQKHRPTGGDSARFRLYEVKRESDGTVVYVWERNPMMARGRATEAFNFGIDAHPFSVLTEDDIIEYLVGMSPERKRKLLESIRKKEQELEAEEEPDE